MENHVSKEEFLLEFFGNFGREFGNPKQWFVDNPNEIFPFIETCKNNKVPAFMSVQPRSAHYKVIGLEKIFFDFDYADKTYIKTLDEKIKLGELTEEEKMADLEERKRALPFEVKRFVNSLVNPEDTACSPLAPLIIKTNKGYHVYIYFDTIYEIDSKIKFWMEVYGTLYRSFYKGKKYRFIDTSSETDIFRMSRIPFSIHEKSGIECIIVDNNLNPTKIRGLGIQKTKSLKKKELITAKKLTEELIYKKAENRKLKKIFSPVSATSFGKGTIRPCFINALNLKEMENEMRLCLLLEAWYKENKHDLEELVDLFRPLNDFDERKTTYYVQWFLNHEVYNKFKPRTCKTIMSKGWCIQDKCPKYKFKK